MNRSAVVRVISGLGIIALGTALLLNSIGTVDLNWIFETWWPILFVVAGLLILLSSLGSWIVSLILIILGTAFQLEELGYTDFEPWQLIWPTVLILVGAGVLTRGFGGQEKSADDERQDITAILSGSSQINRSAHFKSSMITAIMGGVQLDLRKANIDDQAVIEVVTFWGGIEIIVPDNVVLKNQTLSIMAGVEDQTLQKTDKKSKILIIKGMALMGGVSIRSTSNMG